MNQYLHTVHQWFATRNLQLSTEKSTATLFTASGQPKSASSSSSPSMVTQSPPPPPLQKSEESPWTRNLELRARNSILKAITSSYWGKSTEAILMAYGQLPVANYATAIWSQQLSQTNWNKLQVCQNTALRIATGCLKISNVHHLHSESLILPVKQHCDLLTLQYLQSCQRPAHPCHALVTAPPPSRSIKRGLHQLQYST